MSRKHINSGDGRGNGPDDEYSPINDQASQKSRISRRKRGPSALPSPSYRSSASVPDQSTIAPTSRNSKASSSQQSNKGKIKTFGSVPTVADIDLQALEDCEPPVKLRDLQSVIIQYKALPPETESLYEKMKFIPHAVVPPRLRVSTHTAPPINIILTSLKTAYEADAATPRKSKAPLKDREYMSAYEDPYPTQYLGHLKERVDSVLEMAAWCHQRKVHERQWGAVAHSMLEELSLWPNGWGMRVMNVYVRPQTRVTVMD
ncbi:MAG: hypothetical protein Q9196_006503 [Gyalolechia fulgens]